jgi:hypothetical protein
MGVNIIEVHLIFKNFFAVLRLELMAYNLSHSTSPFLVMNVFKIESHKLFAWTGFEPRSS